MRCENLEQQHPGFRFALGLLMPSTTRRSSCSLDGAKRNPGNNRVGVAT
jgi:hypothetical protein